MARTIGRWLGLLLTAAIAAFVAACATTSRPQTLIGATEGQVNAIFGKPIAEFQLADGVIRRFYRASQADANNWRIDFDKTNQVVEAAPATTSPELAEAKVGQWHESEILEAFGPPRRQINSPNGQRKALIYPYQQFGFRSSFMYFIVDEDGRLVSSSVQVEKMPEGRFQRHALPGISDE